MFIWVAKFGAAYGVPTGIHVVVEYSLNGAGLHLGKTGSSVQTVS